ncbi:MAG: manganese efflux pump [Pararoseburia sp.]|nr:manganese efflux pump [Pararoseburia sp.]
MNWIENILIIAGISLDIFAAMEIEGAMLADVKRKSLIIACTLVALLQLIFFFGGYFTCYQIEEYEVLKNAEGVGYIVAVVVFALLGVRLIAKAIKREFIHERRRDGIRVRDYIKIIAVTSFYTLVAGCACGFVGTSVIMMAIVILTCSVLVVVGGLYTGYHFGFESKTGAYVVGAILLWIAGGEILLRSVLHVI